MSSVISVHLHLGDTQRLLLALLGEHRRHLLLHARHLLDPVRHRLGRHGARLHHVRCVLEHLLEEGAVTLGHNGDRAAVGPSPRGASDTVYVCLELRRQLEVDHRAHALDVEAAAGEVGGQ